MGKLKRIEIPNRVLPKSKRKYSDYCDYGIEGEKVRLIEGIDARTHRVIGGSGIMNMIIFIVSKIKTYINYKVWKH